MKLSLGMVAILTQIMMLAAQDSVETFTNCPPINHDLRARTNAPFEAAGTLECVVLGSAVDLGKNDNSDYSFKLKVEKVIYGSPALAGNTITFEYAWKVRERGIYALVSHPERGKTDIDFLFKYSLDEFEVESQLALAQARLDYRVLQSSLIVTGVEIGENAKRDSDVNLIQDEASDEIAVEDVIVGEGVDPGDLVKIDFSQHQRYSNQNPTPRKEKTVYLAVPNEEVEGEWFGIARFPADLVPQIQDSLARADSHPIKTVEHRGKQISVREVTFHGDGEGAVKLLESESEAAAQLGMRWFFHAEEADRQLLVEAAEARLLDFESVDDDQPKFEGLQNWISLISVFDRDSKPDSRILDDLLGKLIAHIGSGAEPPRTPERKYLDFYWNPEIDRKDMNHSLAWIVRRMEREHVRETWGPRLATLREEAPDGWRDEVSLALNETGLADDLALHAALERTTEVKAASVSPSMNHDGSYVASWSPNKDTNDRQLLATAGAGWIRIWEAETWSLLNEFQRPGSIDSVQFLDDESIVLAGGSYRSPIVETWNWRDGVRKNQFNGHELMVDSVKIVAEKGELITTDADRVKIRWNLETGDILEREEKPARVSPDGVWKVDSDALTRIETGETIKLIRGSTVHFVPSSQLVATEAIDSKDIKRFRILDPAKNLESIAISKTALPNEPRVAFSPLGDQLAYAMKEFRSTVVTVLKIPSLEVIHQLPIPAVTVNETRLNGLHFSPDGRQLLAALSYRAPLVFDLDSGKPIGSENGHRGKIQTLGFSEDGETIFSVGQDGQICHWRADDMSFLKQMSAPTDFAWITSQPASSGRIALFASGAKVNDLDSGLDLFGTGKPPKFDPPPVRFVDLQTGATISQVDLPLPWNYNSVHHRWLGGDHFYVFDALELQRVVNFRTGKIEVEREHKNLGLHAEDEGYDPLPNSVSNADFAEGRYFLDLGGGGKLQSLWLTPVRVSDLQPFQPIKRDLARFGRGPSGPVPGGEFIQFNRAIYRRDNLELVSENHFPNCHVLASTFTADGKRFAVATARRIHQSSSNEWRQSAMLDEYFRVDGQIGGGRYQSEELMIRVHETQTGKTLAAFPAKVWTRQLLFSPDGNRLSELGSDGTITVRTLPY